MPFAASTTRRQIEAARATAAHVLSRQQQQPSAQYASYEFFDSTPFEFYTPPHSQGFGGIIPFVARLIRLAFQSVLLLALSLVSYQLFYAAVMPSLSATVPLYFDYTGARSPFSPVHGPVEQPVPWAVADLYARHSSWEALETDTVVPALQTSILRPRQPYFIEVALDLPESDMNRQQAGIFGVSVQLLSHNGTALAISRRSARFPHQTEWIRTLQKFLLLVPLLLGAQEESKTVLIPSYRHYVESSDHAMVGVQTGENNRFNCLFFRLDVVSLCPPPLNVSYPLLRSCSATRSSQTSTSASRQGSGGGYGWSSTNRQRTQRLARSSQRSILYLRYRRHRSVWSLLLVGLVYRRCFSRRLSTTIRRATL